MSKIAVKSQSGRWKEDREEKEKERRGGGRGGKQKGESPALGTPTQGLGAPRQGGQS